MRATVQVNRPQFDAMPVVVLPVDPVTYTDAIPIGTDVHVFTDAELRARDERIIRATLNYLDVDHERVTRWWSSVDDDAIIAAAEADL